MGVVLCAVLLFAGMAYVMWVRLPAEIVRVQDVGRRMPTHQLETLGRVEALRRWRSLLGFGIAAQVFFIALLIRAMW